MGKPMFRAALLATAVVASVLLPEAGRAASEEAAACSGHGSLVLTNFPNNVGSLFYAAVEGQHAPATIRVTPGCFHTGEVAKVQAHWGTSPASADSFDYDPDSGTTGPICQDIDGEPQACDGLPSQAPTPVLIVNDVSDEAAPVESFTFQITGRTPVETSGSLGPALGSPSSVPVYAIDDEGESGASLQPGVTYSRSESYPQILIPVFFAGPSPGPVSYTVEGGGASPATSGQDYQVASPNPLPVPGNRVGFIVLDILNDKAGEPPEQVDITLNGGIQQTTTTFIIEDNEESEKPNSRFHHPRHAWRYKKSDYRIREFHVFASDVGPAGVVAVQFALRRTKTNGSCQWFQPGGWQTKDCQNRQWVSMKYDPTGELWLFRMPQLKSSVGTKIKNYTAISRAIDGAENVESQFNEKRNNNTFEIKRRRRR